MHELGHVFVERTTVILNGNPIDHPCYIVGRNTLSLIECMDQPVIAALNTSLGTTNTFIFGKRTEYFTRASVTELLSFLEITTLTADNFGPYIQHFPNDPTLYLKVDGEWLRGIRGWGSGAPSFGPCDDDASSDFLPTEFQQNPCAAYIWIELVRQNTTPDDEMITTLSTIELSEAAADMFLNWVYRTNNLGGFQNMSWPIKGQGTMDTLPIPNLEILLPNSFPVPRQGPGDDRFYWMNSTMQQFFVYYGF